MSQVAILFSGTPDVLVANYSAVATAITNAGLTIVPGPIPIGGNEVVPDTTTLLTRITNFRLYVRINLSGTNAQYDSFITALQTIKASNPGLNFSVSFGDSSAI